MLLFFLNKFKYNVLLRVRAQNYGLKIFPFLFVLIKKKKKIIIIIMIQTPKLLNVDYDLYRGNISS